MRNNQVSVTWSQDSRDIKTDLRKLKNFYAINQSQFCHSAIVEKIDNFYQEQKRFLVNN